MVFQAAITNGVESAYRTKPPACYSSSGGDGGIGSHEGILSGEPQEAVASTSAGVT